MNVNDYELTIWQAENGFVVRIGSCQGSFVAKDKHELASLITSFTYKNEKVKNETNNTRAE